VSLASALKTGDIAELPSRRDEDWRWTDLRGLIRTLPAASPPGDAAALKPGPFDDLADETIVFLNGRRLTGAGPVAIAASAPRAIALRFVSQAHDTAHHCGLSVDVAPGATLTVLETYEGTGAGYVADVELDIRLGEGARLTRIVLIDEADDVVAVSTAEVELAARAAFAQTALTAGAKRQRFETRLRHGAGAQARLDGVYLLDGERRGDLTSEVIHNHLGATTQQLTRGCVRGQARGVFQGRIIVNRGADGTDARMGHHALILSERAEVDAKPELEIYADDVSCSHGNIPDAEARALLTEAFVGEVVDRIEHEGARDVARAWVADRLRAAS
jgi:Fe-S cluster assembly protein SufD